MTNEAQLTPQQTAALGARSTSVGLSAGAGCGKTFVLTQRFLQEIAPPNSADKLHQTVAITFTERAAREMRDRIRSACRERLRRCPSDEVNHWLQTLRGLDSARISTIHSFCASFLRAHAVDAGLDPQFGVLEQATGEAFLSISLRKTIERLLVARDESCRCLVREYGFESAQSMLSKLVRDRSLLDWNRHREETPDNLANRWLCNWNQEVVPRLLHDFSKSDTVRKTVELLSSHETSHAKMADRRSFLLGNLPLLEMSSDPATFLAELRGNAQVVGGGGKKAWESEEVYEQVKNQFEAVRKQIDGLLKLLVIDQSDVQDAAELAVHTTRVLAEVITDYEQQKQQAGMLDFDDLMMRTHELLKSNLHVRRRAAAGISFLMVDEFQDTDPIQAEIVKMLCGDELTTGKLFLVGDAKQSIYRFRRADPRVFHTLRSELPEEGQLPLSVNFRSQPAILNFVNCLFTGTMGDNYEALQPHSEEQLSPEPTIEFLFATTDANAPRDLAGDRRRNEAEWIARRIRSLLDEESPCIRTRNEQTGEFELRRARSGDIVVLFRSLNHIAHYEEALRNSGIDYYLVGGRAFYAQQEVFDLVNFCQYLDDPNDELSLASLLRSPFFSLNDDTLFALVAEAGSLGKAIESQAVPALPEGQQRQAVYAAAVLHDLLELKDRVPLSDLLNAIIDRTGYDASLLHEFMGRRKLANLRKLIEMAAESDAAGFDTLSDFVTRLRDSLEEETDEELASTQLETGDVVRLMTIHQSKGLEFPVVIVADMDWRKRGPKSSSLLHPEFGAVVPLPPKRGNSRKNLAAEMVKLEEQPEDEAETNRLLYVATTRAADYLFLSAGLPANGQPQSPWLQLVASCFNLQTGLPAVDPYLGRMTPGDIPSENIPQIRVHLKLPDVSEAAVSSKNRELSLAQMLTAIEDATPVPFPETLRCLSPALPRFRRYSVSQLDDVDTQLHEVHAEKQGAESRPDTELFSNLSPTAFGQAVHKILEQIDFSNVSDVPRLAARSVASVGGTTTQELTAAVLQRAEVFLQSSIASEIETAAKCFRELEFLLPWQLPDDDGENTFIAGVIDCLFATADEQWHLIDYKTGHGITKRDPLDLLNEYELQMGIYAFAVRNAFGRLPASARLILVDDDVVELRYEFDDRAISDVARRVSAAITRLEVLSTSHQP